MSKVRRIRDLRPGDVVATTDKQINARIRISGPAKRSMMIERKSDKSMVAAWCLGWVLLDPSFAGRDQFDFFDPEQKIMMS